ncbi:hypothetical protein P8C59_006816 [Phyllachora maydis]|uniref:non-specific serine/threonine protein kinase n=1 Tax=Phyllachora maydis TaxID=1825666 RepID=A0AAD9I7L0_9PEZI|nr:hypothetical protein P8C59_006816 [Phyllachora maydis]
MADRPSSSTARRHKHGDDSIGNFYIDQEIGKGSFAQVYSGRHKATGALVAIKAVELARLNKKLKDNLYGEIQILKALRHPHIVALHDCVESATHINLIMEYCELGDLSLFIKRREKLITNPATHDIARKYPNAPNSGLNEVVIRHFLKQLASALKFLREGNLVHRDIEAAEDVIKFPRETVVSSELKSLIRALLKQDLATRSDVVYGFAEVKYKQLVPLAPSMEHALGGRPTDQLGSEDDDDGLTAEAKLLLSEEALVLYVKALSLLAKSMDIASLWWTRKTRNESSGGHSSSREIAYQNMGMRINSAVQWIRTRFNEVLEKAEIIRLKLVEAQNLLPEDHASHPSNHRAETTIASGSSADGVFLTPGISAEKLMYERAVEMSRNAAINEIANEDLPGCELSYITAIRMLEAVLDNDDELPKRRVSGASKEDKHAGREDLAGDMDAEDQQVVQKMIQMVTTRLGLVRKKTQAIAAAAKAQQQQQQSLRRRSGDMTTRGTPAT